MPNPARIGDYDSFYASVFEVENPALKAVPLAVQQKQIVVTCNYEARRRGLRKLQLIKEAKKVCPDVVIVLGEDLTRFRDASKEIYTFLKGYVSGWGGRVERLGFDEVFLDVTSLVDYNIELLNYNDLSSSFFHLDKTDPTQGFAYDARTVSGPSYPPSHQSDDGSAPYATSDSQTHPFSPSSKDNANSNALCQRLILGSHLAGYIRTQLEEHKGYTATVGISTSKLLAKLAGNVHKPRNQTTLLPPYDSTDECGACADDDDDNHNDIDIDIENDNDNDNADKEHAHVQQGTITRFLDAHDISAIPGIGFKIAQKIRAHILGRQPTSGMYEQLSKEDHVTVRDVRLYPGMCPRMLNEILLSPSSGGISGGSVSGRAGAGGTWPRDIGMKVWGLLHGIDPSLVAEARAAPTQISIEDSYGVGRLEGLNVSHDKSGGDGYGNDNKAVDGRSYRRGGGGGTWESIDPLASRLVNETILPLFRRLHPEKSGAGKICVMNVAVTNMVLVAGVDKGGAGRDIGRMFRSQGRASREWRVEGWKEAREGAGDDAGPQGEEMVGSTAMIGDGCDDGNAAWDSEEEEDDILGTNNGDIMMMTECVTCGAQIAHFALRAHEVYHSILVKLIPNEPQLELYLGSTLPLYQEKPRLCGNSPRVQQCTQWPAKHI
ncbi:DNA polymerase iota [Histoplasma capsulatum var. duboisii H88]|uniref:DNA polymerase iota n=1 Tax=Ajellomyces capsulatus (strain H88) TaxID=544711 RepID=F0UCE5_AJEC8|nr:DNA polymerase iota [Histoplasma capsulatum var. duboisii H88]